MKPPDAEALAEARRERIELIKRTHEIFCGLKKREIDLRTSNPPGRTDCETYISIPTEDPEADLIHKHEWQHIFFKSNLYARAMFVEEYARQIKARFGNRFVGMELEEFLHGFCNGLDDIRVCSLWGRIYPRSAIQIEDRWRRVILTSRRYATDIVLYAMALGLNVPPAEMRHPRPQWEKYESLLMQKVPQVRGRGFPSCLKVTKDILDAIIEDVLGDWFAKRQAQPPQAQQPPPMTQPGPNTMPSVLQSPADMPPAFAQLHKRRLQRPPTQAELPKTPEDLELDAKAAPLNLMVTAHKNAEADADVKGLLDTVLESHVDPNRAETTTIVAGLLSNPVSAQQVVDKAQLEIEMELEALTSNVVKKSKTETILKGMDHVSIHVAQKSRLDRTELDRGDEQIVEVLKSRFSQLMNRRRRLRSESGSDLDVRAYMDLLNGSGDSDVFLEDHNSKGFSSLILLDVSGSMKGIWPTVCRSCKVLSMSMKGPNSNFEVWGFSSRRGVELIQFEDTNYGYSGADVDRWGWGGTPMLEAMVATLRKMRMMPGAVKHLFLITDGLPNRTMYGGSIEDTLLGIRGEIEMARRSRINVSTLLIGNMVPDEMADVLFGPKRWQRVESTDYRQFYLAMVKLVSGAFASYLRGI